MTGVVDFVRVLLPRSNVDGALAMLTAYFDDTGTHDTSPVLAIAGLIGNESIWSQFEAAWRDRLSQPLPGKPTLRRFHMADCMARQGEFVGYSDAEADAVTHDFRQIIIGSGVYGYAVGVSRADWDQIVAPTPMLYWFGDAEAFCFRDCVAKMLAFVHHFSPSDKDLSLVFDNRPHRTTINEYLYKQYQKFPEVHGANLLGVSFLASEEFVPLQGADMFAWEFYTFARHLLAAGGAMPEPRPHARQFFDCGRFHMGVVDHATCERIVGLLGVPQA
jgi:hypothetical protein